MTKLECSAKNCVHYAEGCCCKSSITVDGAHARCAEDTCCASFSENTGGVFKNLFKTPEAKSLLLRRKDRYPGRRRLRLRGDLLRYL